MSGRLSSPTFVGRDEELRHLDGVLTTVRTGQPALVLIGGEAGIGKTRLVDEFTSRLDDVLVLTGGCLELGDAMLPYAPLVEILRELGRTLGADAMRRLLTGPRRDLRRLLPDVSDQGLSPVDLADPFAASGLYEAVLSLLDTLAADRPVVAVVEDVHWAARSTLGLLSFLGRNLARGPVLVVATFRTDELHRRHALRPVVAELVRLPSVDRLDLSPLTDTQLATQVGSILGHPPHQALLREIVARSEGNAFYAEELLAAATTSPGELPPTLRDILADRLAALPDRARDVLRVVAAAGRRVDHELLERVAEVPATHLHDGLREAVAHQVLLTEPDGRHYRFRHALLQEAVYDDLLPGERTGLHRAIADALSEHPDLAVDGAEGADAEIAHHAHAAHRVDQAFTASLRAARRARAVYAYGEAHRHLERALELWSAASDEVRAHAPPRMRLLRDAAAAASFAGDQRRSIAHLGVAVAEEAPAATPEERGDLLAQLSWMLWLDGQAEAALATSAEAVEVAQARSRERAAALAWRARLLMLLSRPHEALEPGRSALALARDLGDVKEEAQAANALGTSLGMLGQVDEGERLLRSCIRLGRELRSGPWAVTGYTNLSSILDAGTSRFDDARQVVVEGLQFAEDQGWSGPMVDFLRLNLVDGLRELGLIDEADRQLQLVVHRLEPAAFVAHHAGITARLWLAQGRFDEARDILERTVALTRGIRDPQFRLILAEAEALLALAAERYDDARRVLDDVRHLTSDRARYEKIRPLGARVAAEQVSRARFDNGLVSRARHHVQSLREDLEGMLAAEPGESHWAAQLRTAVLQVDAEASRIEAAPDPEAWARAEVGVAAQHRVAELGYLRMRRAESLIAVDRRGEAAEVLREVHSHATGSGLVWLADQAEAVARRGRVPLPGTSRADDDPFGLTPREREVLSLVAQGHTNREIGEQLFITDKTASVHVTNILAKLPASSRREAARIARQHGLDTAPA